MNYIVNEDTISAEIPNEILIIIFKYLTVHDIINCSLVSKKWLDLSRDNLLWKLHFYYDFKINFIINTTINNWLDLYSKFYRMEPINIIDDNGVTLGYIYYSDKYLNLVKLQLDTFLFENYYIIIFTTIDSIPLIRYYPQSTDRANSRLLIMNSKGNTDLHKVHHITVYEVVENDPYDIKLDQYDEYLQIFEIIDSFANELKLCRSYLGK